MSIGTALREARTLRGMTQGALGRRLALSDRMISMMEGDHRELARDIKPKAAVELDDPRLYLALASEATGGIGPIWLDGTRVDLHRVTVREKTREEIGEILAAFDRARCLLNARSAEDLTPDERQQLKDLLVELIEGQTALAMMVAVTCRTYDLSMAEAYDRHRRELMAKGLLSLKHNKGPALCRPAGRETSHKECTT